VVAEFWELVEGRKQLVLACIGVPKLISSLRFHFSFFRTNSGIRGM